MIDPNIILETVMSAMKPKLEQTNARIEAVTLPLLPADPYLFTRLLTNILDNALKFRKLVLPPVIKIKYSRADEMNSVHAARPNTPYIIISVSDNGIGFGEKDSEKIFKLFSHLHDGTKYKGSGIGLAICRKIMNMHGGFIAADGSMAQGATINCYFPVSMTDVLSSRVEIVT